jgi:hypothetical protein
VRRIAMQITGVFDGNVYHTAIIRRVFASRNHCELVGI